jgi:broad specificity phosphatase PhoE
LHLIRHGESIWNAEKRFQGHADPPLSEKGNAQAERLAARFREADIAAVYSSPLQRAQRTAEVIAKAKGLEVRADERLKERDVGLFTGLTWEEIVARYPDHAKAWATLQTPATPKGESLDALQARAVQGIAEIVREHVDREVAVVSHGGLIGAYLLKLLNTDPELGYLFHFDNASVTIVELNGAQPRLYRVNDISHLLLADRNGLAHERVQSI